MRGDEAQLYRTLAPRVERIVRLHVRAAPEVIEDACHHAWTKLINDGQEVDRGAVVSWLTTTAVREAWKLDGRERREHSLEAIAAPDGELPIPSSLPGPDEQLAQRERLAALQTLPERQQRMVWLRALGLSYHEMAAYTGESVRSVERQIARASKRMRELHQAREQAQRQLPPERAATPGPSRRAGERAERGLER
jgi:RNA polymerase sigma factor (sigma-70 family)